MFAIKTNSVPLDRPERTAPDTSGTRGQRQIRNDSTENQFEWTSNQCLVFLTPILLFVIIVLLISSNTVQPQATYVAYALIVISVLAILVTIIYHSIKDDSEDDRLIEGEEQIAEHNQIYTIDSSPVRPSVESQSIAFCLPEIILPPKYEFPPSYAQAIASWKINSSIMLMIKLVKFTWSYFIL